MIPLDDDELALLLLLEVDVLLPEDVEEPLPALGCRSELLVVELLPAEPLVAELPVELLVVGLVSRSSCS